MTINTRTNHKNHIISGRYRGPPPEPTVHPLHRENVCTVWENAISLSLFSHSQR